ncbi:FAD-binding oxidoreductase [Candidatus Pelagibacter sp.]|nr:FAD-binding oxidoreductase [Candidatus Pelagibacter sp.]
MKILNDNSCGWLTSLQPRKNFKILNQNQKCDYLIIGAGYTGLSAARKLSEINSSKKIIIVDAQLAGEGSSSRNSGYLVDTTLNDGFTSNKDINNYKTKVKIYNLGITAVKNFIKQHQADCDWNECGKYFASSITNDLSTAKKFSELLSTLNFNNKILNQKDLENKLGTSFYKIAVFTEGGILINPAKLVRAMIDVLPRNIELYENSPLIKWNKNNNLINCQFEKNSIQTNKIIFCTNGFLKSLNIKKNFNFPLTLTASMTRPLDDEEFESIGKPKEWGVLPIRPMGATIRFTKDRRLLIRNTAEMKNPNSMTKYELEKRKLIHLKGLIKRFPTLKTNLIEDSWSGIVSRSRNSSQIFEMIDKNIYVAGCYNGSGIGVGTLFGEQIAIMASDQQSNEIEIINKRVKPNWLPPSPILNLGVQTRLFFERLRAKSEI